MHQKYTIWQDGSIVSELAARVFQPQEQMPSDRSAWGTQGAEKGGNSVDRWLEAASHHTPAFCYPPELDSRLYCVPQLIFAARKGSIKFTVMFLLVLLESRKMVYTRAFVPANKEHT